MKGSIKTTTDQNVDTTRWAVNIFNTLNRYIHSGPGRNSGPRWN